MFSVFQLTTVISIIIAVLFLAMFVQLRAFRNSQKKLLFFLVVLCILLLTTDLLVSYGLYNITIYIFPLYYPALFITYPLFYLYFKTFAFRDFHFTLKSSYKHLTLTGAVFVILGVYFITLPYDRKIDLINGAMIFTETTGFGYFLQYSIYAAFYLQLSVYIYLYFRLIKKLRNPGSGERKNKAPIIKWIIIYLAGTVLFEILILLTAVNNSNVYSRVFEQAVALVYIFFIGFLGINQSMFLIQTRLYQASNKPGSAGLKENDNLFADENEKLEFERLIELVLEEKKLFLDPNIKLEIFAKKIHVPQKKLSQAIHDIYGKNFTNFINDYRIREAVKILKSDEKISMYVLSRDVGFNSRSTFNRAFKDCTGETPRDFVLKHKGRSDP